MKVLILIGLTVLSIGCGQKLPGAIVSFSEANTFGSGEASLLVEEQGTDSNTKLVLETNRGRWKFSLPKSAYLNSSEFYVTSEETGQKIGVSLRRQVEVTSKRAFFQADFTKGGQVIGRFTSQPVNQNETRTTQTLTSLN